MKRHLITVAVVVAAVFVTSLATVKANNMLAARPATVAVVNVADVYNNLKERDEIDADLNRQRREFQEEDDARQQTLKALQDDLKILPPDGDAFTTKRNELRFKVIELKAWREFKQLELEQESALQKERLYRKICDAVGEVARLDGYDMVFYKESNINFEGANAKQLDALIALRKLLYTRDDLEITERVVQKMNNDFVNAM